MTELPGSTTPATARMTELPGSTTPATACVTEPPGSTTPATTAAGSCDALSSFCPDGYGPGPRPTSGPAGFPRRGRVRFAHRRRLRRSGVSRDQPQRPRPRFVAAWDPGAAGAARDHLRRVRRDRTRVGYSPLGFEGGSRLPYHRWSNRAATGDHAEE